MSEVRETKRDAIIHAALGLFVEKGIHATTTREIARRAGTVEGNIYRHFSGKDELAGYLFNMCAEAFHQALTEAILGAPGPEEQVRALVGAIYDFAEREPLAFGYLFQAQPAELARLKQEPLPMGLFRQVIKSGIQRGVFLPLDPALATGWIFGMVQRSIVLLGAGRLEIGRSEVLSQTSDAVLRMLLGDAHN